MVFKIFAGREKLPQQKMDIRSGVVSNETASRPHWSARNPSALTRTGYLQNPIAFRAVRLIAEAAAAVKLHLQDQELRFDKTLLLSLKASLAYIERETGLALIERTYVAKGNMSLPLATQVSNVLPARIISAQSEGKALTLNGFEFVSGENTWVLTYTRPNLANAEIQIAAGFEGWAMFPKDIQLSTLKLTDYHFMQCEYPNRPWPLDINAELGNYKTIRLGFSHER